MKPPPSLTVLANEEGTDKGTRGPVDDWPAHNYTDVYDGYLHRWRDEPITLLEIGMGVRGPNWDSGIAQGRNAGGGASIRMWRRYFTRARILGIDINPAPYLDDDRVTTGVVDQGEPDQLLDFLERTGVGSLDVVIDDGSHQPHHQQVSFSTLFPRLAPGGLYFIEDLLDNGSDGSAPSAPVLSTRRLFSGFIADGAFPAPHALADQDRLEGAMKSAALHCPAAASRPAGWRRSVHAALQMLSSRGAPAQAFEADSEQMCVVEKAD